MEEYSFSINKSSTSFSFINDTKESHGWSDRHDWSHYIILEKLLNFMKERGFKIKHDEKVDKVIREDHWYGRKNDLEFVANRYPRGFSIEFFQNIKYENRHGGRYDFDKFKKMPYLIRLLWINEIKKMAKLLESLEIVNDTEVEYKLAEDRIKKDFVKCWHHENIKDMNFKLSDLDRQTDKYGYNHTDRDKKIIHNGEIKYFRNYKGYIQRGKVYHNINNMWWVIVNDTSYTNMADFELFDLNDEDKKHLKKIKKQKLYMNPKRIENTNQEYRIGDNLFIINCKTGLFKAVTEYGHFEYHWSSSDNHKQNIVGFNKSYILDKLAYGRTEIDFEPTIKDWKETIIEWRKDRDIEEEKARNLWDRLEDLDSNMSEEYICRSFYDVCEDNDIDCPYESFYAKKKYTDDVIKFWGFI
jgi:hypothetical protein